MTLSRLERETICRFSEEPGDPMVLDVFSKKQAARLIRDGAQIKRHEFHQGVEYWILTMPRDWFRWPRKPRKLAANDPRRAILAENARTRRRQNDATGPERA